MCLRRLECGVITVQFGSMNPGTVNTGFGGTRSALDPQV